MVVSNLPLIEYIDNFLSSDECELYQNLPIVFDKSKASWYDENNNQISYHPGRTSETAFAKGLIEEIKLKLKISAHFDIDINTMEDLQFTRYRNNQEYKAHHDYFTEEKYLSNNRIATLIIYLNENFRGGTTEFPLLNLKVKPKTGSAVFFKYNYTEEINKQTLHAGMPVIFGTKNIITSWIRKNSIVG